MKSRSENRTCGVHDKNERLLMKVKKSQNRLYKIELEETRSMCLIAQIGDTVWLWHTRLGHISLSALKSISDKKIVEGLPKIIILTQPCEGCLLGKHTRNPFPAQAAFRAKKRLDLIHGDLCGPITPPIPTGNR